MPIIKAKEIKEAMPNKEKIVENNLFPTLFSIFFFEPLNS